MSFCSILYTARDTDICDEHFVSSCFRIPCLCVCVPHTSLCCTLCGARRHSCTSHSNMYVATSIGSHVLIPNDGLLRLFHSLACACVYRNGTPARARRRTSNASSIASIPRPTEKLTWRNCRLFLHNTNTRCPRYDAIVSGYQRSALP